MRWVSIEVYTPWLAGSIKRVQGVKVHRQVRWRCELSSDRGETCEQDRVGTSTALHTLSLFLPLCLSQAMLNAYLECSTRQKLISWRARDLVSTALAAPSREDGACGEG
jgi:hypothetical protein